MNPVMMIPHNYKYKKSHPNDNQTTLSTTKRYSGSQKDLNQLRCHSPSKSSKPSWENNIKAFIEAGHVEEYDGLCWCE
eukprot:CAMPEP_0197194002 /NCGR_PEP_ID=MMETSP1423-20130617/28454_1 /TAXON_ID=476441 /ORGANISM="Pseudo-nitzschia heimii, Strain UNC1101" /LENGTH=77 /DNA_ID=CAMNT_0042647351 /DNA_START=156 /DNA_END=389 /DNA_ORIENTATION=+